jgi:cardiolipin synthase
MNLPNKLTISRIFLIPVFIIFLINGYYLFSFVFFGIASLTDALDGIIARIWNQKSMFGFFCDPIADKLLINTSFIALAIMKFIPWWLAIIVLSRDILITLGVMAIYMVKKKMIISPTLIGKLTTTVQMLTILITLLNLWMKHLSLIVTFFVWISTLLTIVSGFDYFFIVTKMSDSQA